MSNVILPPATWVNLYAATGITVGTKIIATNITPSDVRLADTASAPTPSDDHFPLLFRHLPVANKLGASGAWAFCSGGGAIDVREA